MSEGLVTPEGAVLSMDRVKEVAKEGVGPDNVPNVDPAAEVKREAQKAPFSCQFKDDGTWIMEIDLKAAVVDADKFFLLRGFVLTKLDEAMSLVHQNRAALAAQKAKILKVNQAGGFRSFLQKLGRA